MNTLILIKGTIEVSAKGYWFTSGGEKSSFGFYPHLKKNGFPIFPDTQLHGDLRMAANWLSKQNKVLESLVEKVFGKKGNQKSSLFSISDLELDKASRESWSPARFSVKPRTEIDDDTRSNREKMLAFFEFSYLDDLRLTADFYMGYFKQESEAKQALNLLKKSLRFLSLGANRSRGCGRGIFRLYNINIIPQSSSHSPPDGLSFRYTVTPLTNFRNRPINPGRTQLIRSQKLISARQMRGWFANAFYEIYGVWPSLEEISTIRFSSFYPLLNGSLAYPPPLSTLQLEDGSIQDFYEGKEDYSKEEENLVHSKAKPPKEGTFLTNEDKPRALRVETGKRFRNSMDEKFVTKERRGLFAQELILRNQPFSGTISFEKDDDFRKKALFVLENVYPKINGTFFESKIDPEEKEAKSSSPFILTEPLEFTKERWESGTQFRLDTIRGYNTTLHRPCRNRIVFAPGSLMEKRFDGRAIVWKGLNKEANTDLIQKPRNPPIKHSELPESDEKLEKMTRSQAGILRLFLEMDANLAEKRISDLLSKYGRWNKKTIDEHLIPEEYLEKAKELLSKKRIEEFRQYIQNLLDKYVVTQWEKNQ